MRTLIHSIEVSIENSTEISNAPKTDRLTDLQKASPSKPLTSRTAAQAKAFSLVSEIMEHTPSTLKASRGKALRTELANTDLLTETEDSSAIAAQRRAVKALELCLRHTNVPASGKPVHRNSEGVTQSTDLRSCHRGQA